jgi:hypothetical protein
MVPGIEPPSCIEVIGRTTYAQSVLRHRRNVEAALTLGWP